MSKRVMSVGNCRADHRAISGMLELNFQAEVVPTASLPESLEQLRSQTFDLVLVNRILDSDGSEGLDVIRQIKTDSKLQELPVMMITNFPEHQQQAIALGAVEGFGKRALNDEQTRTRLEPWLK